MKLCVRRASRHRWRRLCHESGGRKKFRKNPPCQLLWLSPEKKRVGYLLNRQDVWTHAVTAIREGCFTASAVPKPRQCQTGRRTLAQTATPLPPTRTDGASHAHWAGGYVSLSADASSRLKPNLVRRVEAVKQGRTCAPERQTGVGGE